MKLKIKNNSTNIYKRGDDWTKNINQILIGNRGGLCVHNVLHALHYCIYY